MDDHKGDFIVIVAGYPQAMQNFVEENPTDEQLIVIEASDVSGIVG